MPQRRDLINAIEDLRALTRDGSFALTATERTELLGSLSDVLQRLAAMPASEEDYADRRVKELLDAIRAIGRHEFPIELPVSERWDAFDMLATGVNMVAEELDVALRQRTQALGFLGAAAEWFEYIFANVPFMITVIGVEDGPEFRVLATNGTALEVVGRSAAHAAGMTLDELFGVAEGAKSRRHLLDVLGRGTVTTYVRTYELEEGFASFEVTATPIYDDEVCTHIIVFARSIDTRAPVERLDDLLSRLSGRVRLGADTIRDLLTPRELEVLALMATGTLADRAIAAELSISPATARTHVRNIMGKTGVHDRRDLLGVAVNLDT